MKRDWDCIRSLLIDFEEDRNPFGGIPRCPSHASRVLYDNSPQLAAVLAWDASGGEKIYQHVRLLIDKVLIDGVIVVISADGIWSHGLNHPRLTDAGHDLLEKMRDNTIWTKVKQLAKEQGKTLSEETIKFLGPLALAAIFGK